MRVLCTVSSSQPGKGQRRWRSPPKLRGGAPIQGSSEAAALLPTPQRSGALGPPRRTHRPRVGVPARRRLAGAAASGAENARPGACEDTPRLRPRPRRWPRPRPVGAGQVLTGAGS
uniref:Uncharacterized protein n=1 Tax=Castor canadensis TaxID=51338 RepID=A0A8C0ZQS9_CASCN